MIRNRVLLNGLNQTPLEFIPSLMVTYEGVAITLLEFNGDCGSIDLIVDVADPSQDWDWALRPSSASSWITVTPNATTGDAIVTLTVAASDYARNAYIDFTSTDCGTRSGFISQSISEIV